MSLQNQNLHGRSELKIFVASSGELKDERDSFLKIINHLHKTHSYLHSEPVEWETDIPSGSYDKPRIQDEINKLFVDCQIVVVIFFSKVGKFTLEEYNLALSLKKKIFIYFKDGFAPTIDEIDEYKKVLELKPELIRENKTLFQTFKTLPEFNSLVEHDLELYLNENKPASSTESVFPKELNLIPFITPKDVIGRDTELNDVKEKLEKENNLVLVNGIGGVGKTTVAKVFVVKYHDDFAHLAWLNVFSSLRDTFLSDKILMQNLGVLAIVEKLVQDKDQDSAFRLIVNRLGSTGGNNLLILDNPGITDASEISFIKSLIHSNWKILLTSREQIEGCSEYLLDMLTPGNARELFLKFYKRNHVEKDLEDLLREVGYHTLTVELLAKTADLNPVLTLKEILEFLRNHQLDNKRLAIKINAAHAGEKKIEIYPHLLSIFDLNKLTEDEQSLMLQFSVLPSKEIEISLLFSLLNVTEEGQTSFINNINSLSEKGYLVKSGDKYKAHPIIQEIASYKIPHTSEDFIPVIISVDKLLYVDQAKDNPVEKFPYIEFGTSIIKALDIFEDDNNTTKGFIENYNKLRNSVGSLYKELGRYGEAALLLEQTYKSNIKNFGENHPDVATNQSYLALAYLYLGRYKEAAKLLKIAIDSNKRNFGENHSTVADGQSDLASVYFYLGRYKESVELFSKALKYTVKKFGEDHPIVAKRRSNLAVVYQALGKYKEAADLLEKAMENEIKNLRENHPSFAARQSNLAISYNKLGRHKEALDLLEKALESDIKNFGENHPHVAILQSNLALIYSDLGNNELAVLFLEEALKSKLRNFGKNHPETAKSQWNLGTMYIELGRKTEAVELIESSYNIRLRILGPTHPETKTTKKALTLLSKNQPESILDLHKPRLTIDKK